MIDKEGIRKAIDIIRGSMDGRQFGLAIDTLVGLANRVISGELVEKAKTITESELAELTEIIWERVTNAGEPEGEILKSDCEVAAKEVIQAIHDRLKGK